MRAVQRHAGAPAFDTMAGYPARVNELINGSLGRGTSCATVPRTGQGGGATCGCCMALGQPPRLAFPGDAPLALMGEFGHISRAFLRFDSLLAKVIVELAGRLLGGFSSPHGVGGQWEQYTRQ